MKSIGPIRFDRKARVIPWMLLILAYLAVARSSARAQTPTYTWNGGAGNWSNPAFWNNGVPDSASADVFIDGGKTGTASIVTLDSTRTVGRLTLDAGDTFNFNDNTAFIVQNGAFTGSGSIINNGTININSGNSSTDLRFNGAGSISGTGTLNLNGTNGRLFANAAGDRLTIGAGQTIAGAGNLGLGQTTFTNSGTISANKSNGSVLFVQPGGGGADFTNTSTGILQATGGGILQLAGNNGGIFTGGTIQALSGSQVQLLNGATFANTTLATAGTGTVTVTNAVTLNNVTNSGALGGNDNSTTTLVGTFTDNGIFNVNSANNTTDVRLSGSVSLAGTGTLNLNGINGRLFANGAGDRLTIGANQTIAGAGNLGLGQTTFTNNGTVSANQNNRTLLIQPGADFTNSIGATLQSSNGGTLQLTGASGGVFTNNGTIQALAGSQLLFTSGVTLKGSGLLTNSGGGVITVVDAATLSNLIFSGTLGANDNSTTTLVGTFTDNGTFNVNSANNTTDVRLSGPVTLSGTGTLNLNGTNGRLFANAAGDRLTIGANQTIAGAGNLGLGQTTFTNNGTVSASQSGNTLLIQPGGGSADFINSSTGIVQATGGGILQLSGASGGVFTNNGAIQALAGSQVLLVNGVTLTGGSGTLATTGSGVVTVGNTATLSNLIFSGTLGANDNSTTTLVGTFTDNGTFNVNSANNTTDVRLSGPVTLSGTGTLNLNGTNGRLFANAAGDRLTIGANQTIAGAGNLGLGQTTFTNNGTVSANQNNRTLLIQPGGGSADFTNASTGIVRATGGGILQLSGASGGVFTNNGAIQALDGSQVLLVNGVTLTGGGTFSNVGTGALSVVNTATLVNLTLKGTLGANDNSTTTLVGTFTDNGTFNVNSANNTTDVRLSGPVTLSGTGTLNLNGTNGRLFANGAGDRLTIGANQTIAGAGNLGLGQTTFTNNGTVSANQNNRTLLIQPGGGSADFTNASTGIVRATGGGILQLSGASGGILTGGTFQAQDGSQVQLLNGANVINTILTTSGTGVMTILNTSTLTDVTLSGALNANDNSVVTLADLLNNNGTFNVNSANNTTDVRLSGSVSLAGTGTLNLNGTNGRLFANGAGDRLTIGANQTIAGAGNLGLGQTTFTNNGTVSASQSGNTLLIQPGGGSADFTNASTGIVRATGGGILQLSGASGGVFTNNGTFAAIASSSTNSAFNVAAGRLTNFSGTTLTGGTYNVLGASSGGTAPGTLAVVVGGTATLSLGGGNITVNAGNVTLSSPNSVFTEINGLASNTGSFAVANGRNFATVGALANSGTLIAAGGSTLTTSGTLSQNSAGLLQGNGTFTAPGFNLSGSIAPGGTVSGTTGVFSNTAGTLLLNGNTILNPDASLRYQLGAVGTSTSDHLNVVGALTLDGTLYVTALTGFGAGRYDLIDYPVGRLTNNTLDLGTVPSGYNYAIDSTTAGEIDLVVTPVPEAEQWALVPVGAALLVAVRRMIRRETAASRT